MIKYNDLLDVPFVDGGRDPETGLDCWGLVMEVMSRFGNNVPDFGISCWDAASIAAAYGREKASGKWRKADGPAPGLLVVMAFDPLHPGMVQHYGVCLDRRRFIHILDKTKVIVSKVAGDYFAKRIAGFYEWTG